MNLTKQIKADLARAYQCAMEVSILDMKAPFRYINQYISEDVNGYGTAKDEKVLSRKDYRKMVMDSRRQSKGMLFNAKILTPYRPKFVDETTAQFRDEIVVKIGDKKNKTSLHLWFSTLFKYQHNKWQMVMFHGSMPDSGSSSSDTFHVAEAEKKLKELGQVVAQRTADLQMKTRELEIEASLERVRTVTMAMNTPRDILNICKVFFTELQSLGFKNLRNALINFWDDENGVLHDYDYSDFAGGNFAKLAYSSHPAFEQFQKKIRKAKDAFAKLVVRKDGLKSWQQRRRSSGEYKDPRLNKIAALYYYFYSTGVGALGISTFSPISKAEVGLLKKFRNVFDLAYKRYLDIQKAEAQAREAQIEAALERVRSRSMAMHKSEELKEVIQVVYEQLVHLNIHTEHAGFILDYKTRDDYHSWIADKLGSPSQITIPYFDCIYYNRFNEAKKKGKNFFSLSLSLKEKNKFYKDLFKHLPGFPETSKKMIISQPGFTISTVLLENVALYIENFTGVPFSDEENKILLRFGKVFQQTYTRFLDLQKAEAQARESQIQLALERVRARTMAMQKSDELLEAGELLCNEMTRLGIRSLTSGYVLMDKDEKIGWNYTPNPGTGKIMQTAVGIPHTETKEMKKVLEYWKKQEPFSVIEINKEDTIRHQTFIAERSINFPLSAQELLAISPPGIVLHNFNFREGYILIVGGERLSGEQLEVMLRFAKVFQQTYTRFLDLQKAEAQTRQAQIEAAMEKVRARAMAMQKPSELIEVAELLRKEMGLLGVEELETSSIYIHHEESGKTECWYAIKDENKSVSDHMTIDLNETSVGRQMLAFCRSDEKHVSIVMKGDERKEWINYCANLSEVLTGFYGDAIPDRTYHLYKFSNGYMGAASPGDISTESRNLLQRATNVFSLAYTRFSDLQLAEASAKEAIKQAALDRIRADIASMRTISDLDRITPLIWNELTTLGIPFIRCGVFIMNDAQQVIHTFLSTPDGKAIAAFHLPYDTPGNISQVISNWRCNDNYIDHWDETEFSRFADMLVQQGVLQSAGNYLKTIPGGGFYLHFLPFLQGMLYVGNSTQLGEEDLKLLQSVADAFSTAYARYEDFNKLEAAKKQVDSTLTKLQTTQKQLIQSEKMASLGELTAGIAHEIQNPLNFVNNFSEVSKELLDEMKEAIEKSDTENAKEIMNDVIQNLEKINHHGKRADAIVKGMLQHSRKSEGKKEPTDINALCDEYLRLAYHGFRAKDKSFGTTMKTDFDESIGNINIIPQDTGRVVLNLITNAFYVVNEKSKQGIAGYEPTVEVSTKKEGNRVLISVKDNGNGIPDSIKEKIFQPFFTTKPTGQGTGLGLSLSYDIIKAHGGELKVNTKEKEGTEFIIQLPDTLN
ncbi:MAG: nuclear transport factor 2 family protein [Chitinophagaceae bacterium]|nr:nuclear transport factor 2 family protein [Chitinophagaceae bacterium]